ncbi:MAG TPA: FHA domain-containing protein [Candidatus Phocaeicola excrementigallinarum]|nr:FHA domain-containing protein [Candidatus Phocaeicola excrementigallinarum]
MKRVRCPKCDHYIQFDETKYETGQSLVFICDNCNKQFSIRIGKSRLNAASRREEKVDEREGTKDWGNIVVIENVFAYKQVFPLHEGDNLIGRRNKGNEIDIAIESNDPSLDRRHCYIHVKRDKQGKPVYTLRDNDSVTGTFLMNGLLGPKDRVRIEDGAVVTLGATTFILHEAERD